MYSRSRVAVVQVSAAAAPLRRRNILWGLAAAVLGSVYLLWTPPAPDLAAQVARADAARIGGTATWWTAWFGGVSLPTYSLFVPAWMAWAGVALTGLMAVVAGSIATAHLVRDARRPRAGALAFTVAQAADVLDGRVTFAVGVALGAWSLVALRNRRSGWCVGAAVACLAASPLAGLFLGIGLIASTVADRSRRTISTVTAALLVVFAAGLGFLFPGTGTMPFHAGDVIAPVGACVAILIVCPQRQVRVAAAILLAAIGIFFLHPGAVGQNITRLAWIGAAPAAVAWSSTSSVRTATVAICLLVWPAGDLTGQLAAARTESSQAAFYRPVAAQVTALRQAAGPTAVGRRLEVVDTADHWGSAYLSPLSLARGWDRQVDRAVNPIFYRSDALTTATYRTWLNQLAVGWVALPMTALDYASAGEGRLVRTGLPYLSLVWSNRDWQLFRVRSPTNLVDGAHLISVGTNSIVVRTSRRAVVRVRMRWSSYLEAVDATTGTATASCVLDDGGWVRVYLPRAETVSLVSRFDLARRLSNPDGDCVADVQTTDG